MQFLLAQTSKLNTINKPLAVGHLPVTDHHELHPAPGDESSYSSRTYSEVSTHEFFYRHLREISESAALTLMEDSNFPDMTWDNKLFR